MYRPVASSTRSSFSGMAASRAAIACKFLLAHAAAKNDQVADVGRQSVGQTFEVLGALGQDHGRPAFADGLHDILADELIAGLVGDQFIVQVVKLASAHPGSAGSQRTKSGRADEHGVRKRTRGRLLPWHRRDSAPGRTA